MLNPVIINIRSIGLPDGPYSTTLDRRDGTVGRAAASSLSKIVKSWPQQTKKKNQKGTL